MQDEAPPGKKKNTGAPAWVMTFADLMSLLMCFFVLLLSFSEMDVNKYKQIAGSMQEAFGVQRKHRVKEPPKGINVIAKEFSAGRPDPTPFNVMEQMTTDEMKRNLDTGNQRNRPDKGKSTYKGGVDDPGTGKEQASKQRKDVTNEQLVMMPKSEAEEIIKARKAAERRKQLEKTAAKMRAALKAEIEGGKLEVETEDQKIIIRIREKASFSSGGVELRDSFRPILVRVSQILKQTNGRITIAGHTDNVPVNKGLFRSNWDLSALRAVSVMLGMVESVDIDRERFSVRGYGDTRPRVPNATPAQRAKNRRVEIILEQGEDLETKATITGEPGGAQSAPAADPAAAPGSGQAAQDPFVDPQGAGTAQGQSANGFIESEN